MGWRRASRILLLLLAVLPEDFITRYSTYLPRYLT